MFVPRFRDMEHLASLGLKRTANMLGRCTPNIDFVWLSVGQAALAPRLIGPNRGKFIDHEIPDTERE